MFSVRCEGLTSGYGDTVIVRDARFQMEAGEIFALIGKNGAGKTTFLKTLIGLVKTRSGLVELFDEDVTALKQARADGSIKAVSAGYLNPIVSQKSRADVRAEVLAAARSGELERLDAEAYAFDGQRVPAQATRVAQAAR